MANFAQLRSLGARELQPPVQLAPQDSVFCGQILIPQQQFLIHRPRDEGQNAGPLHKFPRLPLILNGLHRSAQKRTGRHVGRLRRHRINTRLSYSFNFLTVRANAHLAIPTSPAAIFFAVSSERTLKQISAMDSDELVERINAGVALQAIKYVYGVNDSQLRFVSKRLGRKTPTPPLSPFEKRKD
jgi:hypothetical protein